MTNSKNKGWVRLSRQIEDNCLWFLEPFTKAQAWIDLFLNANHKNGIIQIRGNVINIDRGQIGWSELTMMKRWKWSKNKVRRFLKLLETEQQIEQQKLAKLTTIITILKYDDYQSDTTDDTTEGLQKDYRRYTNKNDKNVKNDKKCVVAPTQINNEFFNDFDKQEELVKSLAIKYQADELTLRNEINKFVSYWTEPNKSGTKQRWQLQPTFELSRRIATWLNNFKKFSSNKPKAKII